MRQTGYYFVKLKVSGETIMGYWNGAIWYEKLNRYTSEEVEPISPTPITPEKMAAIEYVIDTISKVDSAVDKYFDIKDILNKHGLLPQPEKPKAAYYKGKKISAVFNIPDETKYDIFVPHRIQVDKSEIEWREIN